MDEDTFYRTFYKGTAIPKEIPIRLRKAWAEELGPPWHKLFPQDNPFQVFPDDLDLTCLMVATEREFGVVFPAEDVERIDGSFDSVVQYLAKQVNASPNDRKRPSPRTRHPWLDRAMKWAGWRGRE